MKPVDWAILALVLLVSGAAVFFTVQRKKRGRSCCGDCSACGAGCVKKDTDK